MASFANTQSLNSTQDAQELLSGLDTSIREDVELAASNMNEQGKRSFILYSMILDVCENYNEKYAELESFTRMWNGLSQKKQESLFKVFQGDLLTLEKQLAAA